ncbi:MAG: acyl carrier protein [Elusimicrobia bacterium]|nr:acyl carrier protein [Elusimicrobiota bacterium]
MKTGLAAQVVLKFFESRGVDAAKASSCEDFFAEGLLTSIELVKLAVALEGGLGVRIRPGDVSYDRFRNLEAVVGFVNGKAREQR